FAEWMCKAQEQGLVDFVVAHPEGYELSEEFTQGATLVNKLDDALQNADFVYVKNWSSYKEYGKVYPVSDNWMMDNEKLKLTNDAKVMHCLPVRRDLELSSEILDGPNALVIQEASNRVWAAQLVLKRLLEKMKQVALKYKCILYKIYMSNSTLNIIKIGGNVIDDDIQLDVFLEKFAAVPGKKILVHGGGKIASRVAESLGVEAIMVEGRRITDEKMLDVVTMVYAGLTNKKIVATLQKYGCDALGLSGA